MKNAKPIDCALDDRSSPCVLFLLFLHFKSIQVAKQALWCFFFQQSHLLLNFCNRVWPRFAVIGHFFIQSQKRMDYEKNNEPISHRHFHHCRLSPLHHYLGCLVWAQGRNPGRLLSGRAQSSLDRRTALYRGNRDQRSNLYRYSRLCL